MNSKFAVPALLAALSLAAASQAQTFSFNIPNAQAPNSGSNIGINNDAGLIKSLQGSFNNTTKEFAFTANFGAIPNNTTGLKTDGFWLVLSPGKNPKGSADELAIFYFDATNPNNATLTAYAYNGVNGNNSFAGGNAQKIVSSKLDSNFLKQSSTVRDSAGNTTLAFRIDATKIQNYIPSLGNPANWTGAKFGPDKVGLWFHPTAGSQFAYSNGWLTQYGFSRQGWFDGENFKAVPEPMTMGLLALGLAGIAARRKRKS